MLKLIIGVKGTGKTKQLIQMVNEALETSNGGVVCIEKGDKLKFDVKYQCRLVDTESYGVDSADALFGFVAGILASNHDVTDLYIDSALKICKDDVAAFETFVAKLGAFADNTDCKFVVTSSLNPDTLSEGLKKYID